MSVPKNLIGPFEAYIPLPKPKLRWDSMDALTGSYAAIGAERRTFVCPATAMVSAYEQVEQLKKKLNEKELELGNKDAMIACLEEEVSDLEEGVSGLEEEVACLEEQVEDLEGTNKRATAKIAEQANRVDIADANLKACKAVLSRVREAANVLPGDCVIATVKDLARANESAKNQIRALDLRLSEHKACNKRQTVIIENMDRRMGIFTGEAPRECFSDYAAGGRFAR